MFPKYQQKPSTGDRIVGLIYSGTTVNILGTSGSWYKVSVDISGTTVTGYVFAEYITRTSSGSSSGSTNTGNSGNTGVSGSTGKVNTSALNFRTGASTSSTRIGCIYMNQEVTILGKSGDWYQVKASVNGTMQTGYVSAQYITIVSSGSGSSGSNSGNSGNTSVTNEKGTVNDGPLNVRTGPSTGNTVICSKNKNARALA